MAMPQRDETIEEIKRLEPPSPRLRPTLKLRHDKSADKYEIGGEGVARRICRAAGGVLPLTPGGS